MDHAGDDDEPPLLHRALWATPLVKDGFLRVVVLRCTNALPFGDERAAAKVECELWVHDRPFFRVSTAKVESDGCGGAAWAAQVLWLPLPCWPVRVAVELSVASRDGSAAGVTRRKRGVAYHHLHRRIVLGTVAAVVLEPAVSPDFVTTHSPSR